MSTRITNEEQFLEFLRAGDWRVESNQGRDFLLCTIEGVTVTFSPVFQAGRQVWGWQFRDSRLPSGFDLVNLEDESILSVVRQGWDAALKERNQRNAEKAAAAAARPLDDGDVWNTINSIGNSRLMRVVVARVDNPAKYRTFDSTRFDLSQLRLGEFAAGIVFLGKDFSGHRIGTKIFRNTDETLANRALQAASQAGVLKSNRRNRTEVEMAIRDGSYFD